MKLNVLSIELLVLCFPDDSVSEAIESDIAASLPVLASLAAGMSDTQRLATFQHEVSRSRSEFFKLNGDLFGCDETDVGGSQLLPTKTVDTASVSLVTG